MPERPDATRRALIKAASALAVAPALSSTLTSVRAAGAPGAAGDFNFLTGDWKISHRRLKADGSWDEFTGEATCWSILGGVGSIEELRIPARKFAGMGLRLLDVEQRVWNDFWVNAQSGVLTTPGLTGSFADGVGTFEANDVDGDTPIKVRGIWDRIGKSSCRWQQTVSRDGGKTWRPNWLMDWVRS
jgi:hypothetical protein